MAQCRDAHHCAPRCSATAASAHRRNGRLEFIARPNIGAARLSLPSQRELASLARRRTARRSGHADAHRRRHSVLRDVLALRRRAEQIKALRRHAAVSRRFGQAASSATTIAYDLELPSIQASACHGGPSLDLPADIACSVDHHAVGQGATLTVDIRGATRSRARSTALGRHRSIRLEESVQDATCSTSPNNCRPSSRRRVSSASLAFDTPPARRVCASPARASMSDQQFQAFVAR